MTFDIEKQALSVEDDPPSSPREAWHRIGKPEMISQRSLMHLSSTIPARSMDDQVEVTGPRFAREQVGQDGNPNSSDIKQGDDVVWVGGCFGIYEIPASDLSDYYRPSLWLFCTGAVITCLFLLLTN